MQNCNGRQQIEACQLSLDAYRCLSCDLVIDFFGEKPDGASSKGHSVDAKERLTRNLCSPAEYRAVSKTAPDPARRAAAASDFGPTCARGGSRSRGLGCARKGNSEIYNLKVLSVVDGWLCK